MARDEAVAQIVLNQPRCARVFVERGIDFCCRGQVSLAEACAAQGIEEAPLLAELEEAIAEASERGAPDPRLLTNLQLVAHIVDQHHVYLRKTLPLVEELAARVASAHGERQPTLRSLHATLRKLWELFERHLQREEAVVFPLLVGADPPTRRVRKELAWMQADHVQVGDALHQLRLLADRFRPPPWACTTYRALMTELETMERDTLEHVHLENNVLAPRFAPSTQRS